MRDRGVIYTGLLIFLGLMTFPVWHDLAAGTTSRRGPSRCTASFGPANHHAVTALQSPHSATGSHVHVMNAFAFEFTGPSDVVFEKRVAAVDDGVAGLHVLREFLHRLLGGIARRHHDPHGAGELQFADQIFQ